jgi:hypothetical protein
MKNIKTKQLKLKKKKGEQKLKRKKEKKKLGAQYLGLTHLISKFTIKPLV